MPSTEKPMPMGSFAIPSRRVVSAWRISIRSTVRHSRAAVSQRPVTWSQGWVRTGQPGQSAAWNPAMYA